MAKQKEIGDFGEKIGGARKDLAQFRLNGGFGVDDIGEWTDVERDKHIVKAKVFMKPDYQALYDTGNYSREALYFQSRMYKALPTKPNYSVFDTPEDVKAKQDNYLEVMSLFREKLAEVTDTFSMQNFGKELRQIQQEQPQLLQQFDYNAMRKINRELVNTTWQMSNLRTKMEKDKFLYSDEQEKLSNVEIVSQDGNVNGEYVFAVKWSAHLPMTDYVKQAMDDSEEAIERYGKPLFTYGTAGRLTHGIETAEKNEDGSYELAGTASVHIFGKSEDEARSQIKEALEKLNLGAVENLAINDSPLYEQESRITVSVSRGRQYYYFTELSQEQKDPQHYEEGKYIAVIKNDSKLPRAVIGENYESAEEAKQAALEYVTQAQVKQAERKNSERKSRLTPPQLAHVHRVGEDYTDGIGVQVSHTEQDGKTVYSCPSFQSEGLAFRGVEFGNWENQNDRQANMDMAYDSFKDMTKVLGISEKDASLGGDLALAFGARGRGNALAHFEPDANVINITKMRGAGTLGHEWGHALDYAVARAESRSIKRGSGLYETEAAIGDKNSVFHEVYRAMMYKPDGSHTDFYKDAIAIDNEFSKSDKGYWQSEVEMFARAFHTYLKDKCAENGIRNDYLNGHAEFPPCEDKNGKKHYTYPRGEERDRINQAFDKAMEQLLEKGFFHEKEEEKEYKMVHLQDGVAVEETQQQLTDLLSKQLEIEAPEEPSQEELQAAAEEIAKQVLDTAERAELARKLQIGDIVRLNGQMMLNGRTMKPEMTEPEYGRVTEISDEGITFRTNANDKTVAESWRNGFESINSTPDEHWSEKLAKQGYEPVSVKALEEPEKMSVDVELVGDSLHLDVTVGKQTDTHNLSDYGVVLSNTKDKIIVTYDYQKGEATLQANIPDKHDSPMMYHFDLKEENAIKDLKDTISKEMNNLSESVNTERVAYTSEDLTKTVYFKSHDDETLEAVRNFINANYANVQWSEDGNAVQMSARQAGKLSERLENSSDSNATKALLSKIQVSVGEPFPEDKEPPEIMHIMYVEGEGNDIAYLRSVTEDNATFNALWSEDGKAFEISDSDLVRYTEYIQSPLVQQNEILMQHITKVDQSLDEPFEKEKAVYLENPVQLSADYSMDGDTREQNVTFKIGEHTNHKGETNDITYTLSSSTIDGENIAVGAESVAVGGKMLDNASNLPDMSEIAGKCREVSDNALKAIVQQEKTLEEAERKLQALSQEQKGEKPMEDKGRAWRKEQEDTEPPKKGTFRTSPRLKALEETMQEHEPFAVMALSTSGLGDTAEPVRVVVQEYTFDNELKQYTEGLTFDRQAACSQEQLDKMLTSEDYDYFGNAGIDKDAYIRGEGVLSKEQFTNEFARYMQSLDTAQDTILIINGGADFAEKALHNLEPDATVSRAEQIIADKESSRKAISQTDLTIDYFRKNDIHEKATLENLRNAITKSPSGSFREMLIEGSPRMEDFKYMSKEEFLRTANVTSFQYDATKRDFELRSEKIIGADARTKVIADFATFYGREKGILEGDRDAQWRESSKAQIEELSKKGREHFESLEYESKLKFHVDKGHLDPEAVMDASSDCDLNRLANIMAKSGMDGNGHNEGFVVMQAATTGIDYQKKSVGEPIQISATAYTIGDDGNISLHGEALINYNIQADPEALSFAIHNKERAEKGIKGGFDTFKDAGIDLAKYQEGVDVHSSEEAVQALYDFFEKFPPDKYPIISSGSGQQAKGLTLAQEALQSIGTLPAFSDKEHNIDFVRFVQEYAYRQYQNGEENVLFDEETIAKGLGLKDILEANAELKEALTEGISEENALVSTGQKVDAIAMLTDSFRMQELERTQPELYQKLSEEMQAEQEQAEPINDNLTEKIQQPVEKKVERDIETETPEIEDPDVDIPPVNGGLDIADLVDDLDDIKAVASTEKEHGRLYSDKQGDTRDVVIVEGDVRKVAEVPIPHVSEAAKEQEKPKEEHTEEQKSHRRIADRRRREVNDKPTISPRRRESDKENTQPVQDNVNVSELLAIIQKQQEQLAQAQKTTDSLVAQLARKDEMNRVLNTTITNLIGKVADAVEKQTELQEQLLAERSSHSQEQGKPFVEMTTEEKIGRLEELKTDIAEIKDTMQRNSKGHLAMSNANMQLTNAQKEIERDDPTKKVPKLA